MLFSFATVERAFLVSLEMHRRLIRVTYFYSILLYYSSKDLINYNFYCIDVCVFNFYCWYVCECFNEVHNNLFDIYIRLSILQKIIY